MKPLIYLGADHAGFALKESMKAYLKDLGYEVHDCSALQEDPLDDYPDFIIPAAEAVAKSNGRAMGIVFGGSGNGECIAANKVHGIRAALIYDEYTAKMSRIDNDANVLCLAGRTATKDITFAHKLVQLWLDTPFSGEERHKRRITKITTYENDRNTSGDPRA